MSSLNYDAQHNKKAEERLKRLRKSGLKLPWERKVEKTPDNPEPESIESGESDVPG